MKKLFILCISFLFSVQLFALSDIQLGLGGPFYDGRNGGLFSIILENHNFVSEDERFGMAESILVSPLGFNDDSADLSLALSFFIGPTYKVPVTENTDFVISAGFKYCMNYLSSVTPMGLTQVIDVVNKKIYSAYCLGLDLQFKFFASKRFNLALGVPISFGFGNLTYTQSVSSTNQNVYYKTLKSEGDFEQYFCIESLCVFVSYQF